jgi:3-hydroxyacyl-CoA dehydrogenase/enoyl-CoA hydratase/3-hydroxybutyryl-CoA epimerase
VTAAPQAGIERSEDSLVSLDVRRDGVAVIAIDDRREAENTVTPALCAQLLGAVERFEQDASLAAAVLVSAKPSFVVGANMDLLTSLKFATDAERQAREVSQTLRRLEGMRKPVVAAVRGAAHGAGFELALACHAVVASDDPRTNFGLPEVRLGLLPAGNGMLRIARRAGLRRAIELALSGKSLDAASAHHARLVDDVCPDHMLIEVAARRGKALVGRVPLDGRERVGPAALVLERNPLGRALLFRKARADARAHTQGHYPAPGRILDVLERFAASGFDAAAELEAKSFGDLVVSETAHRLIELFFATRALEKDEGVGDGAEARPVESASVLGGGRIGSGVAYVTALAGVSVRLRERDDAAAGRALRAVRDLVDARGTRKKLPAAVSAQVFGRVSATTDASGLRNVDIVLEAVSEDLALKQAALREIEPLIDPECVYASSSSSIPIAQIAHSAARPERVLGMHYLQPVASVPLLEVVRADRTEGWAVATAVALGKRQGKTVIVVRDGPGFYTTRVLAPMLGEAAQLVAEGVPVEAVDRALIDWGFPVGPLELADSIGTDVCAHVAQVLHAAFGDRMAPPGAIAKLAGDDREGRRNGRGFYRYDAPTPQGRTVDASVYAVLGVEPATRLPIEEIQMRCALALVNEAVRSFGDGVVRCARDADVGAILGIGFPPFRGGPLRYVDTIGAAETLRRVQSYADRFGERWRPAPMLVQMAKRGERFHV